MGLASFSEFVILILVTAIGASPSEILPTLCIPKIGSVFNPSTQIGSPTCSIAMKVKPEIECDGEDNYFQINSTLSKGDDDEVAVTCSADYPIDLIFDGLSNRHPSLKILFDRRTSFGRQTFLLNFSFPAEITSNGSYIVFSSYNANIQTKIDMRLIPKHPTSPDSTSSSGFDVFNQRPILTNVNDSLLKLDMRVNQDNKRLFMVCSSEFENNIQRLINVYANNPTEAKYKSECLFKNYRCFTKREGSLAPCRTYGLSNYSCRSLDLKPPGGFIGCFTEGYDTNYRIVRKYFVGVDNRYYFEEDGVDGDDLSPSKVINITKAEYNPWEGQPYEFSCQIATYLLARKITWYLVDQSNSWIQLTNDELTEDKKSRILTSRVNITFPNVSASTEKVTVVCTGYYYMSSRPLNSTVKVNVINSFGPSFDSDKREVKEFDENGYFFLECKAFGIPHPMIEWIKDGASISDTETVWGVNFTTKILRYSKIDKDTPLGDIKCVARNRLGSVSKDFFSQIKDPSNGIYWKLLGTSFAISFVAAVILIGIYVHFKRKSAALTKAEIDAFMKGNPHPIDPDEANAIPQNIPYNQDYEIEEKNLSMDESNPNSILGSGAYGLVLKGVYREEAVAIKTLKPYSSKSELKSLLSELKVMQYIGDHKNIAKLIGASTKHLHEGRALVILELYCLGSLENYLKKFRGAFVNQLYDNDPTMVHESPYKNIGILTTEVIFTKDLINWSLQIAEGMAYLAEICVIHGDLATRNILLADANTIKIADFGLSRKQYANFYAKQSHEPVPWRWMALESLRYLIFSTETDVWSYGVTLWEIFTLAEVPYSGLGWNEEFKDSLARGLRLAKPGYAPQEVYDIMFQCWLEDPKHRMRFGKIKDHLLTFHKKFPSGSEA